MRPVARAILSSKVGASVVSGLVLGISKTPVTPPITADSEPVARSSLCVEAGLAEMDLGVDDAGQDVEAAAVDDLAGGRADRSPMGGDAAVADADVAAASPSWLTTVPSLKIVS